MVDLASVPKEIICDLKDSYKTGRTIDEFFLNTEEYVLNLDRRCVPLDFEVKYREISYLKASIKDELIYLCFRKMHIIAGVLCTRIEQDKCGYTFFRDLNFLK
jgi:hypothetical protein